VKKGGFAFGYATHPDRVCGMVREKITDPWREVEWEGDRHGCPADAFEIRGLHGAGAIGTNHLVSVHERRGLRRPENGPCRVRQQQRRHVRASLPLAHGLWAQADVR
jgi:hypothetical protein